MHNARSKILNAVTSRPISTFHHADPIITATSNTVPEPACFRQCRHWPAGRTDKQITGRLFFSRTSSTAPDPTDIYRIIRKAKSQSLVFTASTEIQTAWSSLNKVKQSRYRLGVAQKLTRS
jgi:hypothetical protein